MSILDNLLRIGSKRFASSRRIGLKGLGSVDSGLRMGQKVNRQISSGMNTLEGLLGNVQGIVDKAAPIVGFFSDEKGDTLKKVSKYMDLGKQGVNVGRGLSNTAGQLLKEGVNITGATKKIIERPSSIMSNLKTIQNNINQGESTIRGSAGNVASVRGLIANAQRFV